MKLHITACMITMALLLSACGKEAPSPGQAKREAAPTTANTQVDFPTYDARTFYQTTSYGAANSAGLAFSADSKQVLVSSDESGIFNATAFDLTSGDAAALTDSTDNAVFAISFFPDDGRLLYSADQGGNELNHVYLRQTDGSIRDLTPGKKTKAQFIGWHQDGASFYIATNERDGRNFDLYRYQTADYARELLFENNQGWALGDLSRDGRWLALNKLNTSTDSDIFLQDLSSGGSPVHVTPHQGKVRHGVLTFTPDSSELYYNTNEFGEFAQAWSYHLDSGERTLVHADDWGVSFVSFSSTGRYRVIGVNVDAATEIQILDTQSDQQVDLPQLPEGVIGSIRFSADDQKMAFFLNADTKPNDLFVVDFASSQARQYTQALNPAIDPQHLVEAKVVRYPSFDQLPIPAILYKPKQASADNPVPALVWVHGGPGGQTRRGYSPLIQHLVNHGYAILGANNRGSSGYGKTFFHMDDKRHGEEDLKDIVWGHKYLASQDWVDSERIGVIGGSYGGYMTAAALTYHPEVFDVGIDIFGVTNWERTLKNIPPWWESFKQSLYDEMGDPATDAERHRRISPLFHAHRIVRPLLVIQGANDPRVLKVESDELVAAVKKNEVPVEYVVFDDEGHGFRNKENRITASNAYLAFLDRYLKGKEISAKDLAAAN